MQTIPENKIELHLKLGRVLACFVKVDTFFESRTFDWIKLEKEGSLYKATLIRSIDEGDEFFSDVTAFETLNNKYTYENLQSVGEIDLIKKWCLENFELEMNAFYQLSVLKEHYIKLVQENKLGN